MKDKPRGRLFTGKSEELPVMAGFMLTYFKADIAQFKAHSHLFSPDFVKAFEAEIKAANRALNAGALGTASLKEETAALYRLFDETIATKRNLRSYIELASGTLSSSLSDFGLAKLSASARKRDAEGVLAALHHTQEIVAKNLTALKKAGLTDKAVKDLAALETKIRAQNQAQFEKKAKRASDAASSLDAFNTLYIRMRTIQRTGKTIFHGDPVKVRNYTMSELKKKVRIRQIPAAKRQISATGTG
jgi:hypothetical protein